MAGRLWPKDWRRLRRTGGKIPEDLPMTSFSPTFPFQSMRLHRSLLLTVLLAGAVLSEAMARAQDPKPKIVIRTSPQDKRDQKVLQLRPNPALEQPLYVFVNNPTPDD